MDQNQTNDILVAYKAELERLKLAFELNQDRWLLKMRKLYGAEAQTVSIKLARGTPGSNTRRLWTSMERARVDLEQFIRRHGDLSFSLEGRRYAPAGVAGAEKQQIGTGAESGGLQ